jgi:SPP1 family predicted phage head-tail adaptor
MMAGNLDRRIDLQRFTTAKNSLNEDVQTWATFAARIPAQVTPVQDGERFRAGEVASAITTRFVIRHTSQVAALNPRDRLVFEGRTFEIHGVKELARRVGLEISAAARAE